MSDTVLAATKRPSILFFGFVSILSAALLVCVAADLPAVYAPAFAGVALAAFLLFADPLRLLFFLIVVRMSLDYFGETVSISLTNSVGLSLSQSIGLLVASIGFLFFLFRVRTVRNLGHLKPLALIFFWGICTLFFSTNVGSTVRELLRVFDIVALSAMAAVEIRTPKNLERLLRIFFVASVVPVLTGLYQFAFGVGFKDETVSIPRIYGTFSHPNTFSLYLFSMVAVGTLYFFLFANTRRSRAATVALIAVYVLMLFLTYTRIAWLVLLLFLFILALFRFRSVVLPLVMLPFLLYVLVPPLQDRVDASFQDSPDSSIVWRKNLWKDTVAKTVADGLTLPGYGMNTFPEVSEGLRGVRLGSNDPHNDFVKFFVEGGLVGLAAYLAYAFVLLRSLWLGAHGRPTDAKSGHAFLVLFAFASSLLFASLSDNVFKNTPVQWIFWILLGAVAATASSSGTKPKKEGDARVLR
jgi:putative inorganic carbon (HCO3(-)) transporter